MASKTYLMLATGLAILAMASATTQTTPFVPINLGTITLEQQLCMAQELFAIQFERLGSHYKQLFPTGITGSFTITAARDDLLGRAMFEPGVNQIDINAMALLVSKLGLLPSGHAVNQAAAGDLLLPWGAQYLFGEVHRSIVTHNPELELYMSLEAAAHGNLGAVVAFWVYCKAKQYTPHFSLVLALCYWPPTLRGFVACVWSPLNMSYMLGENLYLGATIPGTTYKAMSPAQQTHLFRTWLASFLHSSNLSARAGGKYKLNTGLQQLADGLKLFPGTWMPDFATPQALFNHLTAGTAYAHISADSIVGLSELL